MSPSSKPQQDPLRLLASVLLVALLFGAGVGLLWWIRGVAGPILVACLLAYAFNPAVNVLADRGVPRGVSAAALCALVLGSLGVFIAVFIPAMQDQLSRFAGHLPDHVELVREYAPPLMQALGIEDLGGVDGLITQLGEDAKAVIPTLAKPITAALRSVFASSLSLLSGVVALCILPVLSFYFLRDWDQLVAKGHSLIPQGRRALLRPYFSAFDRALGGYLHGQLTVGLCLSVFYALGLTILGVRLGALIGLFAGVLNLVPYLGATAGLVLSLTMVALDLSGWQTLIGVCAVFGIAQLLEALVLSPKIIGDRTGLSDLHVILALLIGGEMFGLFGVLIAVPAAAIIKIVLVGPDGGSLNGQQAPPLTESKEPAEVPSP